jgi:hypothetical protein
MSARIEERDVVVFLTVVLTAGCIINALFRRWSASLLLGCLAIAVFWGYYLGGVVD